MAPEYSRESAQRPATLLQKIGHLSLEETPLAEQKSFEFTVE